MVEAIAYRYRTVNGIPARLIYEGRRYRVNDTPTRLDAEDIFELTWHLAMTHPLPSWRGWRFQAIGEDRRSIVFDVREGDKGGPWRLLRTWDYDSASGSSWPSVRRSDLAPPSMSRGSDGT